MRNTRKQQYPKHEVPMHGRQRRRDAPNSLKFMAIIEGDRIDDTHIRSANGMRWRIA
jgi:hypothetical protein